MIYNSYCSCEANFKVKFYEWESCKILEGKVKFHEGEVARLKIGKYNLNVIFNSQIDVNEKFGLGFKKTIKINNFRKMLFQKSW